MTETFYLHFPSRLSETAKTVHNALKDASYDVEALQGAPNDGSLVLFLLDLDCDEEEIYASAPWLKEQFAYSSLKALRLMPFLVYHSGEGDIESLVEERLAETIEAVFSGEFKPFGYDLDAEKPLAEFPSVLESYEE